MRSLSKTTPSYGSDKDDDNDNDDDDYNDDDGDYDDDDDDDVRNITQLTLFFLSQIYYLLLS